MEQPEAIQSRLERLVEHNRQHEEAEQADTRQVRFTQNWEAEGRLKDNLSQNELACQLWRLSA